MPKKRGAHNKAIGPKNRKSNPFSTLPAVPDSAAHKTSTESIQIPSYGERLRKWQNENPLAALEVSIQSLNTTSQTFLDIYGASLTGFERSDIAIRLGLACSATRNEQARLMTTAGENSKKANQFRSDQRVNRLFCNNIDEEIEFLKIAVRLNEDQLWQYCADATKKNDSREFHILWLEGWNSLKADDFPGKLHKFLELRKYYKNTREEVKRLEGASEYKMEREFGEIFFRNEGKALSGNPENAGLGLQIAFPNSELTIVRVVSPHFTGLELFVFLFLLFWVLLVLLPVALK